MSEFLRSKRLFNLFGIPFTHVTSLEDAAAAVEPFIRSRPDRAFLVTFCNPLAVKLLGRRPEYLQDLKRMDMVLSDGIMMCRAASLMGETLPRISFDSTSLAPLVFEMAERHGARVLLVGGKPGVTDVAARRIQANYPNLKIVGRLHGYDGIDKTVAAI